MTDKMSDERLEELKRMADDHKDCNTAVCIALNETVAEIDRLKAENEMYKKAIETVNAECQSRYHRIAELEAENESLKGVVLALEDDVRYCRQHHGDDDE